MNIRQAAIICSSLPLVVGSLVHLFFSSISDKLSIFGENMKKGEDQNAVVASDPSNVTAQMHFRQLQHIRTT